MSIGERTVNLPRQAVKEETKLTAKQVEQECKKETDALLEDYKAKKKAENKRFQQYTDSEYWICICFQTREQKEEYLKNSGLISLGDKYLDGMKVAKKQNIKLESEIPKWSK